MSAIAAHRRRRRAERAPKQGMSRGKKIFLMLGGLWLAGLIFFIAVFGFKPHKAPAVVSGAFTPTNEFKLDTWFSVGPIDFNKGVLYVVLAGADHGRRAGVYRPADEAAPGPLAGRGRDVLRPDAAMTGDSLDDTMARKYFPLIATLFVFILVSNLIGYIPLPINSLDKFTVFGAHIPSFQIYAADTNVAFPLVLSLLVFVLFSWERLQVPPPQPDRDSSRA